MNSGAEWKVKIPTAVIISNQYYSGTSEAKNNVSTVRVCMVRWVGGGVAEDTPSHVCREITVTGLQGPATSVRGCPDGSVQDSCVCR